MNAVNPPKEFKIAMPTGPLFGAVIGSAVLIGVGWMTVASLTGWPSAVQITGLFGSLTVGLIGAMGLLIIKPWKTRPISDWMTLWLAGMVFRLFLTPAAAFLLYSSASLDALSLTLAVALTYLAVLLAEAIVMARHVSQVVSPAARH